MVKALTFKGDKKPHKKRKRTEREDDGDAPEAQKIVPASGAEADDDANWVSADVVTDISGPVMLVLPSEPAMALACDHFGKVFAHRIENMVEGLPESAEPHDLRQVFVATKTVGSDNEFSFKGHQGRYLGCDKLGILSVNREAISQEDTFRCEPSDGKPGRFNLRTIHSKFIVIDADKTPPEPRGDADEASDATHIRLRMQARFKPKHKVERAEKVRAKISRKELEDEVGRRLEDEEVKKLKKARREGNFHEVMLDVKVKGKHDKFA